MSKSIILILLFGLIAVASAGKRKTICQLTRAKASKLNQADLLVPECDSKGEFKPKQCHKKTGLCVWGLTAISSPMVAVDNRRARLAENTLFSKRDLPKTLFWPDREPVVEKDLLMPLAFVSRRELANQKRASYSKQLWAMGSRLGPCFDKDGKPLNKPSKDLKGCDCVVKNAAASEHILPGAFIPQCDDNGLYSKVQCEDNGTCHCTNQETGEKIGKSVRGKLNC